MDLDKWTLLQGRLLEHNLVQAISALRDAGIEAICIKGWSISRFYPDGRPRTYSDIDLAISPVDFDQHSGSLRTTLAGLRVDLHRGLRDRDRMEWCDLFDRSYLIRLAGVEVRVLSDEDNLRVTAAHLLIDAVVSKQRLWDIFYLVERRRSNFDWNRCLDAAGPVRRNWILASIALARDYLKLDVSGLPTVAREFRLPGWFRQSIEREWSKGEYHRMPVRACLRHPRLMYQQIKRRFPPNPIAATTDVEGIIDDSSRIKYQIESLYKKLGTRAGDWFSNRR